MRAFVDKLHAAGQQWAPIFNPGVAPMTGYKAYEEGNADDIWIRDVTGQPYRGQVRHVGRARVTALRCAGASPDPVQPIILACACAQVWPGSVFFPSYLQSKTNKWLKRQMQAMYNQVPFGE
jgi:hypothetical protein